MKINNIFDFICFECLASFREGYGKSKDLSGSFVSPTNNGGKCWTDLILTTNLHGHWSHLMTVLWKY